jgi:deoxyadenosine/deoxycytidine kinase
MIIEFIGSTGAGKTTLITQVQRRLAKTIEVTTSFDLVAAPLGLRDVTHPTTRNLIQELVGFPFLIRSLRRHKAFVIFTLRMLARQADFTLFTINNLRSLVRKIGVYEIIRRYKHDRIILVDEGTVLSAHNVFVYTNVFYTPEEIAKFATLIPLPDVIVYIRAPVDSLINRSLQRTDPPREMRSKNRALIEQYVKRAVRMFEQLVEAEEIRSRVLIVENPESADRGCNTAVDYITEFVLNYESVGR